MPFQRLTIATRILAGFGLVLAGMVALGVLAAVSERSLAETTSRVIRNPLAVTTACLSLKAELFQAQMELVEQVQAGNQGEAGVLAQRVEAHDLRDDALLKQIHDRFLGDPKDVEAVDRALAGWRQARQSALNLARSDRRAEAAALLDQAGHALGDSLIQKIDMVLAFASARAERFENEATRQSGQAQRVILFTLLGLVAGACAVTLVITRSVGQSMRTASGHLQGLVDELRDKRTVVEAISSGEFERELLARQPIWLGNEALPKDELGALMAGMAELSRVQQALDKSFIQMAVFLRTARKADQDGAWLRNGLVELNEILRGEQDAGALAGEVIRFLAEYVKAGVGALYLFDPALRELVLTASYAGTAQLQDRRRIRLGEGLLGEAAQAGRIVCREHLPAGYLPIGSALGESAPSMVAAAPFLHNGALIGALELGAFHDFCPAEREFLQQAMAILASGLGMVLSHQEIRKLLDQSRTQEEELRTQQEELQQSNEDLEERAELLERQREAIRHQSRDLAEANRQLLAKATEVAQVSSYKSQFLANMSHELRTPLNSLLILSRLLADNPAGNLTLKQVDYAKIIHGAGSDLLALINDVLDIAKIESGHMDFLFEEVAVTELVEPVAAAFRPLAEDKKLDFLVTLEPGAPVLRTDVQRTRQILNNLLANAIKFTERGGVALEVALTRPEDNPLGLPAWSFAVRDTGIGISRAKFDLVFQSFQQAESDTSRRFGGTGLGLSISRQLACGMGGQLALASQEGQGSTLTLFLPLEPSGDQPLAPPSSRSAVAPAASGGPAQADPGPDGIFKDKLVLVADDDMRNVFSLASLLSERGMTVLESENGREALTLLAAHPEVALVLMDVMMPEMDGLAAIRTIRSQSIHARLPIIALTAKAMKSDRESCLEAGASDYLCKPIDRERLLSLMRVWLCETGAPVPASLPLPGGP